MFPNFVCEVTKDIGRLVHPCAYNEVFHLSQYNTEIQHCGREACLSDTNQHSFLFKMSNE